MAFIVIAVIVGLVLFVVIGRTMSKSEERQLRNAGAGATRVKTVSASSANGTVQRYARLGWRVVDQSTAKSLGTSAKVTMTFRKG